MERIWGAGPVRIGVYDRYWATGGGGEKFAAGIAAALAADHDVELVAHEPVDRGWLGERLNLDLGDVGVALAADHAGGVSATSAGYDVFVNASYQSGDPNRARRGVYVVHFPGPLPTGVERVRRRVATGGARLLADPVASATLAEGFYLPEPTRLHAIRWTAGEATVTVRSTADGPVPVLVLLGRYLPAAVAPREVTAEVDGTVVGRAVVAAPASRWDRRRAVPLRFHLDVRAGEPVTVVLRSEPWTPADVGIGADRRRLGVPVIGAQAGGGWRAALASAVPVLAGPGAALEFLDTYHRVLANSQYTRMWTGRMWGRDSGVLYPPVTPMALSPAVKDRIVLSVGRFFRPGTGHNKKQLEMVRAFRRLHETGGADGWTYHLVGGCAPEHGSYLDDIRDAAQGLPVVVHADASGAELADLYGRAAIFWHAAGLGEHPDRHPDRYEHFGITTVEAMSAGAVPVVIDSAGQAEIVEQDRSGLRFSDLDGLVEATRRLVADEPRQARLSAAAQARARDFAWDSFVDRVRHEVENLG